MMQMIATVAKPGWRLTAKRLFSSRSAMAACRAGCVAHIDQQGNHHNGHQGNGEGGAERPVPALAELKLDQVAKHHVPTAAQDARGHVGAERWNEDENGAGDDARLDKRNNDAAEHLEASGI